MFLVIPLVALLLPLVVGATSFQIRGYNVSASYANRTASLTAYSTLTTSSPVLRLPFPTAGSASSNATENGGYAAPTGKGSSANGTCGGCVVNIPSANVDWWYAVTYRYPVATLAAYSANITNATDGPKLLTRVPDTSTFDVSGTIQGYDYTETSTWDSEFSEWATFWDPYSVLPSATVTSIIYRTDTLPLPTNGIILSESWQSYSVVPSAASVVLTGPSRTAFVATSATPFAYFSVYQVEKQTPVTASDGRVSCQTVTHTFNLSDPYGFAYDGQGIEDQTIASGDVPANFLDQIAQTSCSAGTFQGVVTVLVVVDLVYQLEHEITSLISHLESSVPGLELFSSETATANQQPSSTARPSGGGAASKVHLESSVTDDISQPTSVTDLAAQAASTGVASDLPGFFSIVRSFQWLAAHLESTATPFGQQQATTAPSETGAVEASTTETVATVGSQVIKVVPSSAIIVGSQTLVPGGAPITVGGVPVSLAPSATAVVIDGQTVGSSATTLVVEGETITAAPLGAAPSQAHTPPVITVGSATLTANAVTQYYVAPGQILTPGGEVTVSGTVISLAPSASYLVVAGSTHMFPTAAPTAAGEPILSVGNSAYTAVSGSTFVISGQTLTPGGTIVVSGTTLSLGPSASIAIVNGVTQTLGNPAAQITPPPLTIGNGVFSAQVDGGTTYFIGGSALTPGGTITIAGTTIVLAPSATAVIVNGQTTTLLPAATITNAPLLTIGSATYTALPGAGTTFVIGGQTLTPGGDITVSGTTISLSPAATALVFGSGSSRSTETLFPATTTGSSSGSTSGTVLFAGATATGAAEASASHGAGSSILAAGSSGPLYAIFTLVLGYLIA